MVKRILWLWVEWKEGEYSIGSMFGVDQKGDAGAWKMSGGLEIGGSGSQKSADSGWL